MRNEYKILVDVSSGSGVSFPRSKMAGAWSWPLTASRAEVKNAWSYTSTPPMS